MHYTLPSKLKTILLGFTGLGIIAIIFGFITDVERTWANLFLNAFFYTSISLAGIFFVAVHNVGLSGWQTSIKRIPEAMGLFIPIGGSIILILIILGYMGVHNVWHWMQPGFAEHDIIFRTSGKKVYLDKVFFMVRSLVYVGGWSYFAWFFRKLSLRQEREPDIKNHKKGIVNGAIFLIFFAVSSTTFAWDWVMSIDVHWFSTLFGWYTFMGYFVSSLCVMLITTLYLKNLGLLPIVNENHIHDLTKYVFAFSIFWTYLWFGQYMLYWYANIPEEVNYFVERFKTSYYALEVTMITINFIFPLVILMSRHAKRKRILPIVAASIILVGHYLDAFQMIMPGSVQSNWTIGFLEIGMFLGFGGLFTLFMLSRLASANLVPVNHPYLGEAKQHHI